jgi:enoyl-CoA hydratase/carnithine racemase
MANKILVDINRDVMEIILNNPDKMNCMGFEMLYELEDAIRKAASNNNVRAVLIRGAGERAFSTGADLKEFNSLPEEKTDKWIELGNDIFNTIEEFPKPCLAYINGYAIGGGFELALACDFRFASETAVLASVELQHGWLPGWGGMTRLRRLVGEAKAKEIIMLCEKIPAATALEMGLLTRVFRQGTEEKELKSILDHLTQLKSEAFKLAKSALMDQNRTTKGADIRFDVLAMQLANSQT